MTFVILLFMLLFLGLCAVILAIGISDVLGNRRSEEPIGATTTQTNNDDRDSRAQALSKSLAD
jgi:hypothetical protein